MQLASELLSRARAHWRANERTRFVFVGVYNTIFGYATFAVLYLLFGQRAHYLLLVAASHLLAVMNAFVGHRNLTFGAKGNVLAEYVRFNVSYLGVLGLAMLLMPFAVETLELHPLFASGAVTLIGVFVSYLVHRNFTFRRAGGR